MAGSNAGFDAAAFRTGIHFAMNLGAPPVDGEQATFYFESVLVYTGPVDDDNVPFDPNQLATRTIPDPVKVPCAIEYADANGDPTAFGVLVPSRAKIILLDEEYQLVKTCKGVILRGERFIYKSTEVPVGLFDVGVYTMHFMAEDAV